MKNEELNELRDIAFEITIDPNNPLHAASAEDVVKVLSAYINSYKSYLTVKIQSENKSQEEVAEIIRDTKLMVVDTDFNSFHSSLAPYNPNNPSTMTVFNNYKSEILEADMDNYGDLKRLRDDYTKEQLHAIYNPIFAVTSRNYSLKIKTNKTGERKVNKPRKEFETYFKPTKTKIIKESEDKLFQVVVQAADINSFSKKDIIYSSILEHETYPLSLDRIKSNEKTIYLHDTINCMVEYSDDLYFITYKDLNIEVWGETREDAEQAFKFTFYSLVVNYAEEDDSNLTNDAILLKNKLITMIRK